MANEDDGLVPTAAKWLIRSDYGTALAKSELTVNLNVTVIGPPSAAEDLAKAALKAVKVLIPKAHVG